MVRFTIVSKYVLSHWEGFVESGVAVQSECDAAIVGLLTRFVTAPQRNMVLVS